MCWIRPGTHEPANRRDHPARPPLRRGAVIVREVMRPAAATCDRDCDLDEASRLLAAHRVPALWVVDSAGRLAGRLSARTIATAVTREPVVARDQSIRSLVDADVPRCVAADRVIDALQIMRRTGEPELAVLGDGGRFAGVCALPTVAQRVQEAADAGTAIRVDVEAVAETVAAIEPRLAEPRGEV